MKTIRLLVVLMAAAVALPGCIRDKAKTKTYTVTVTSAGNGTAKAEPAKAVKGEEVTLTAEPDAGYDFDKWTVVAGDLTLEDETVNPATFTMPAEDIEISAEFAELDVFKHIEDANFLEYCRQFDTDGDGRLSLEEAAEVTEISVDSKEITSLAGIEYFVSLEDLGCAGNQLETLDLSGNTALKTLWCAQSQLTSLDISANTALVEVFCNDNWLSELDATSMGFNDKGNYTLYCGRQKTAAGDDQQLRLALRQDQEEYWEASLSESPANSNIVLVIID